jgi:hypothetical protein
MQVWFNGRTVAFQAANVDSEQVHIRKKQNVNLILAHQDWYDSRLGSTSTDTGSKTTSSQST